MQVSAVACSVMRTQAPTHCCSDLLPSKGDARWRSRFHLLVISRAKLQEPGSCPQPECSSAALLLGSNWLFSAVFLGSPSHAAGVQLPGYKYGSGACCLSSPFAVLVNISQITLEDFFLLALHTALAIPSLKTWFCALLGSRGAEDFCVRSQFHFSSAF